MLSCADVDGRLMAFLAEELSPVQQEGMHRHLVACPSCEAEVKTSLPILRLTRQLPPLPLPPTLLARLRQVFQSIATNRLVVEPQGSAAGP